MQLFLFVWRLRVALLCLVLSQTGVAAPVQTPQKLPSAKKARQPQPVLPDLLAQRIERAYFVLSRISGTARCGTNTEDLSDDLPKVAPEILLNSAMTAGYDLRMLSWVNNIRQEQALKSELLASIYQHLTEAGIAMR